MRSIPLRLFSSAGNFNKVNLGPGARLTSRLKSWQLFNSPPSDVVRETLAASACDLLHNFRTSPRLFPTFFPLFSARSSINIYIDVFGRLSKSFSFPFPSPLFGHFGLRHGADEINLRREKDRSWWTWQTHRDLRLFPRFSINYFSFRHHSGLLYNFHFIRSAENSLRHRIMFCWFGFVCRSRGEGEEKSCCLAFFFHLFSH